MVKKQAILKTAAPLFAARGFDATTALQIAREAGATEPLIYYHFKGKDDLFTRIIDATFSEYFSRIDELEKNPTSPFGQIQKLIELQYDIAEEMPDEVQLIANFTQLNIAERPHSRWDSTGACPARLNDPDEICAGSVKKYRSRLLDYLTRSLSKGADSGEFARIPAEETAIMILSVINGIVRYKKMNQEPKKDLRKTAVDFCRRSLMNGNIKYNI
jgi:AcrR family transcriptional regulator